MPTRLGASRLWEILGAFAAVTAFAVAAQSPRAKAGKAVFDSRCAICHAQDGKGAPGLAGTFGLKPEALDLTSPGTRGKPDGELTRTILNGRGQMPSFSGVLTDPDILDVVAYIRWLSTPPPTPGR